MAESIRDFDMGRIVLGTAQFGMNYGIANASGKVAHNEVAQMLNFASASKIEFLDTAIAYGDSENLIGELSKQRFSIITKLPAIPRICKDIELWANAELAGSSQRLSGCGIHTLLVHHAEDLLGPNGPALIKTLTRFKADGYVKKIGVSVYTPKEIEKVYDLFFPDIVQAPLNIFDRRLLESGWLKSLQEAGIEVHVRSIFLQGLLIMSLASIPNKFSQWSAVFREWHQWLYENDMSALEACIAYALGRGVDKIVIGANNTEQLREVISIVKAGKNIEIPAFVEAHEKLINPSSWNIL